MSCIFALLPKHNRSSCFFTTKKEKADFMFVLPPLLIMFLVAYHNKQKPVIVTIVPQTHRAVLPVIYQISYLGEK